MTRLNKLLAERGIAARRKCDVLIQEGHVRVNGEVVREPGRQVEPDRDRVLVNGRALPRRVEPRYFALNKPVGVITTLDDPEGRRTVRELMPTGHRLFPVGRLDADTSGLLLLTNDGDLAHKLMHPRYGVEKVYRVRLDREPMSGQLHRLERGVEYEPGVMSAPARVHRAKTSFDAIMVEIAIHEGRHRQVRKMFEAIGLPVSGLHRVAYGPVRLGPMARGMWRELSDAEVAKLKAVSARPEQRRSPRQGGRPSLPSRQGAAAAATDPRTRRLAADARVRRSGAATGESAHARRATPPGAARPLGATPNVPTRGRRETPSTSTRESRATPIAPTRQRRPGPEPRLRARRDGPEPRLRARRDGPEPRLRARRDGAEPRARTRGEVSERWGPGRQRSPRPDRASRAPAGRGPSRGPQSARGPRRAGERAGPAGRPRAGRPTSGGRRAERTPRRPARAGPKSRPRKGRKY